MFCGDGILCTQEGYGEALVELLILRRPDAAFRAFLPGEENLDTAAAQREAPALIGKAPDFVLIGVGHADMLRGDVPSDALARLGELLQLLRLKTQARIALASLCTAFLPAEARPAAMEYNLGLRALAGDRVQFLDLDTPVNAFLEVHRRGGGEKRALHIRPLRPTSMGRTLLARAAGDALGLEALFSS